jgi:hypothetical protein
MLNTNFGQLIFSFAAGIIQTNFSFKKLEPAEKFLPQTRSTQVTKESW